MNISLKSLVIPLICVIMSGFYGENVSASERKGGSFKAQSGSFVLNGEPFVIKAAELHYPRIPKEYWEQRVQLSKALGMNTICLYVFWNAHELEEGVFDFTGQNDIREFIKLCEKNDMKVILRPGPYVCAEWEMGGLPWWLLKKKDIRLRENDPYFLERVEEFQKALANEISDLTIENGGPIIMIQVENEYGSYGENKEYVANIRDILRKYFGEEVTMFQCDWNSNFTLNGLEDLIWTMNFGTGADIDSQFEHLKTLRPDSPLMCSEFWSGWFDKWGAAHETRPAEDMIAGIDEMLSKDISFSLYMTHGGTNWGHWAGANSPGYSPDVTSYDYDAPISENGQPTEKYWMLRRTLGKYLGEREMLADLPEVIRPVSIEKFSLTEVAPLFKNLPDAIKDDEIKTMEEYNMGFGSIMYSSVLPGLKRGDVLTIEEPHDFAQVFIEGNLIGTLDRRNGEKELKIGSDVSEGAQLDILIEATGRINFGRAIKDYKGITDKVTVSGLDGQDKKEIRGWSVYLFPDNLDFYQSMTFEPIDSTYKYQDSRLPRGVYRGTFNVEKPSDTFLNFETWGKGLVYVNGHPIGRIWEIGPQQTLYMPGVWLKRGENELLVFDVVGPELAEVEGLENHIIDRVKVVSAVDADSRTVNLDDFSKLTEETFSQGGGWKEVKFEEPQKVKNLVFFIKDTYKNDLPAIAEIYILDDDGNRLSRENWKIEALSENRTSGNHTADKIIDLQESTYWEPEFMSTDGVWINIDLGEERTIGGLQYLPRMEAGTPGLIRTFEILTKP